MTQYVRVGNRTFRKEELQEMTPDQIKKVEDDGERANQKRLENMRKGLGLEPTAGLTLDVTPKGVAERKSAITAEEAKIVTEAREIEARMIPEAPAEIAGEAPSPEPVKKSKRKIKKAPASE